MIDESNIEKPELNEEKIPEKKEGRPNEEIKQEIADLEQEIKLLTESDPSPEMRGNIEAVDKMSNHINDIRNRIEELKGQLQEKD